MIKDKPNWLLLKGCGESKLLRSSYIWFLLIPILSKIFIKLPSEIDVGQFTLVIELPFSWMVFYFSSVCFSIAVSIYNLRCPKIIKDYRNYSDFEEQGRSSSELIDYMRDIKELQELGRSAKLSSHGWKKFQYLVYFLIEFTDIQLSKEETDSLRSKEPDIKIIQKKGYAIKNEMLRESFWYVQRIENKRHPKSRRISGIFFLIGFILIAVVLLQNFYSVAHLLYYYWMF